MRFSSKCRDNNWDSYKCSRYPLCFLSYCYCCSDEFDTHAYWVLVIPVGNSKFILSSDDSSPNPIDLDNFGIRENYVISNKATIVNDSCKFIKAGFVIHGTQKYLCMNSGPSETAVVIVKDPGILQEIENFRNMGVE